MRLATQSAPEGFAPVWLDGSPARRQGRDVRMKRTGVWRCCWFAGLLAALPVTASRAAPVVIFDAGNTRSLVPFFQSLLGETPPPPQLPSSPSAKAGLAAEDVLPIRTPEMSPGAVTSRRLESASTDGSAAAGARPLLLIGADPLSREWLARHRTRLEEIGAAGMLVQARTVEDLQTAARLAEGLPILPASASEIARLYGLAHYPVLIWRGRIEQ